MLPSAAALGLFAVASLALLVVPGPAVTYIVARSVDQGRAAGLVSVLGIHTGTLFHIAAATVGLSAVLASSAAAFTVVKLAGAAYLIVIGVARLARRGDASEDDSLPAGRSLRRVYLHAVVVNVLNPKTALFFLAFLPQFVEADRGHPSLQIAFLGLVFVALGLVSDSSYAFTAAHLGARLRGRPAFRRWRDRVTGAVYVALGAVAATARSGS